MNGFALDTTYLQLLDGGAARTILVEDDFWQRIGDRRELHAGRLVCMFAVARGDGDHSEVHPAGDEILICTAGRIEIVLEDAREEVVALAPGHVCVVPRGTWHHLRGAAAASTLLAITPGEGTEHR